MADSQDISEHSDVRVSDAGSDSGLLDEHNDAPREGVSAEGVGHESGKYSHTFTMIMIIIMMIIIKIIIRIIIVMTTIKIKSLL